MNQSTNVVSSTSSAQEAQARLDAIRDAVNKVPLHSFHLSLHC
jgi:hypothetical protein